MNLSRKLFTGIVVAVVLVPIGCGKPRYAIDEIRAHAEALQASEVFQYPLEDYFPKIPVTSGDPPKGGMYHVGEDSFAPAGTPVYAIGDGIIRFSGRMKGYGWLIIIDHPDENVYSLYGHLSKSRWKKNPGEVNKGELIAYLAEGEEGETLESHLHFGIRIGQMADYPSRGERRWMAGHINRHPDEMGWYHASEIIGESEPMRAWKQFIKNYEDLVTRSDLTVDDFRITSGQHNEMEDLDTVIKREFGEGFRLADWNDVLALRENDKDWVDRLGFEEGEGNSLLVSRDGYKIWHRRQFFMRRFNHQKSEVFQVHDDIDNRLVCLGSWYDLNMRALAVRETAMK